MSTFLATASFVHDSGLPEDRSVNTWHFEATNPLPTDLQNMQDMLEDFYTVVPAGGSTFIMSYMSLLLTGRCDVNIYDLSAPSPRVPVHTGFFTQSVDSTALPSECALVLSIEGAVSSGQIAARRRNRKYIGPLGQDALNPATGRPSATFVSDLARAAKAFLIASGNSLTVDWVGYSETNADEFDIIGGWVDNAFDTQRRRGEAASSRTTWSTTTP